MFHNFQSHIGPALIVGMVVFAMLTPSDLAAYSSVIVGAVGTAYVVIRTAKTTLDRAESTTMAGKIDRLEERINELVDSLKVKNEIIKSQAEIIRQLKDSACEDHHVD